MELTLEYGANRDPEPIVEGLTAAGVRLDSKIRTETWPDDLELQAAGQLDFSRLYSAVRAVAAAICGKQDLIPVRIFRDPDVADLLYSVPCDDIERAATELSHDIRTYSDEADPFRSWFRGQWMGMLDEYSLTEQELASAPLTAELILEYLDPPINRDWRPIQNYIARKATCDQLSEAMATAVTSRQKSRLAYAFHRRGRSCETAIPLLIGWLRDPSRQVREEAADSLGRVVLAVRHPRIRARWGHQAGAALLSYVTEHSDDSLYFARTALGAMGFEPAREYLEGLARTGSGQLRRSAERGLANLNAASHAGGPAVG